MSDHRTPAPTAARNTPTTTPTPTTPVTVTAAHLGTATVLLRIGDLTVLTDPALDPGPADYPAARPLRRTAGPVLTADRLPPIDLVLLSHDQHADNLDPTGRTVLAGATTVLTTPEAAERLGGAAEGLATWESRRITAGATTVTVTATPARHGPPGTEEVTGPVTGFVVEYDGGTLYLSGDTVRHDELAGIAERFTVDTAFLHLGDAHFPSTGDRAFSMSAREGAELARLLGARTVVPVHYESWEHLGEDPDAITGAFSAPDLTGRLRLLTPGVPESL